MITGLVLMTQLHAYAQDDKKEKDIANSEAVKSMVESKRYVFEADKASPMKGGIKHLDPGYTLTITPETIISDLPFFGQVNQPSMNPSDSGYKFSSTDFEYTTANRKKGGWDIKIKIKDVKYSPQVSLTIFENGSTSVRISSNDRDSISFDGEIKEYK